MSRRRDGSDAINGGRDGMSSRENSLDSGAPSTATPIPAYSERRPRIDGRSTSSRNGRWGHDADGRQDSTSSVPQMSSRTGGSMSSSNQQVEGKENEIQLAYILLTVCYRFMAIYRATMAIYDYRFMYTYQGCLTAYGFQFSRSCGETE